MTMTANESERRIFGLSHPRNQCLTLRLTLLTALMSNAMVYQQHSIGLEELSEKRKGRARRISLLARTNKISTNQKSQCMPKF